MPADLEVQCWDGVPWVGITPFRVVGLRGPGLPPAPLLSRFAEVNVRTYVEHRGRPGIYFLSLDAASPLAVRAARRAYRLPYFDSEASLGTDPSGVNHWRSSRLSGPPAELDVSYRADGPPFLAPTDPFTAWATERYRLFTLHGSQVLVAGIHHRPWRLHTAEADVRVNSMADPFGLVLEGPPRLHLADPQDVVIWPPVAAEREWER